MLPLVSVIIPTHNRAGLLKRAIDSVRMQTYKTWELIIVDDASSDETQEVVRSYKDEGIIKESLKFDVSRGANHARNEGVKLSKGEFLAFLDDDDCWHSEKLEVQVEVLIKEKDIILLGCQYIKHGKVCKLPYRVSLPMVLSGNIMGGFSMCMFRRADFFKVGGLDDDLRNAQDWDLWIRLLMIGKGECVARPLVEYNADYAERITGKATATYYENYAKVVRRYRNLMTFSMRMCHEALIRYHRETAGIFFVRMWWAAVYFLCKWISAMKVRSYGCNLER